VASFLSLTVQYNNRNINNNKAEAAESNRMGTRNVSNTMQQQKRRDQQQREQQQQRGQHRRGSSNSRDSGDDNSSENISNCKVESSTRDNKSKSRDPINSKGPSIARTHGKPTAALTMETAEATATSARAGTPPTAKTRQ
jgi:hypothetical protein